MVPLTIIDLTVAPGVHTFSMGFAILELAEVSVVVRVSLETFPVSQIVLPKAFILTSISVFHNTLSMPLLVYNSAHINGILVFYFFEAIDLPQGCQVDLVGLELDVFWQQRVLIIDRRLQACALVLNVFARDSSRSIVPRLARTAIIGAHTVGRPVASTIRHIILKHLLYMGAGVWVPWPKRPILLLDEDLVPILQSPLALGRGVIASVEYDFVLGWPRGTDVTDSLLGPILQYRWPHTRKRSVERAATIWLRML